MLLKIVIKSLKAQKKLQDSNMSGKIQGLFELKDTIQAIQNDLQKESVPQTSIICNEYEQMYGQMKQLGTDLEQWGFHYTTVQFLGELILVQSPSPVDEVIQKSVAFISREAYLGKQPQKKVGELKSTGRCFTEKGATAKT